MRQLDSIATVPPLDLRPQDVAGLVEELRAYHAIYAPLFQRREQRAWSAKYLHGLLLDLPRKSIEPMVLALEGADRNAVRAMQQFLSDGAWDDGAVLTLDGSDFPKQGKASVGVKRQYCGELGKRANCQAGVFLGYASRHGYTLLDRRLYLPEEWVADAVYAGRRDACGVPPATAFQTKPQLGAARSTTARRSFQLIVAAKRTTSTESSSVPVQCRSRTPQQRSTGLYLLWYGG